MFRVRRQRADRRVIVSDAVRVGTAFPPDAVGKSLTVQAALHGGIWGAGSTLGEAVPLHPGQETMPLARILVVDDQPEVASMLRDVLQTAGYLVKVAVGG